MLYCDEIVEKIYNMDDKSISFVDAKDSKAF